MINWLYNLFGSVMLLCRVGCLGGSVMLMCRVGGIYRSRDKVHAQFHVRATQEINRRTNGQSTGMCVCDLSVI